MIKQETGGSYLVEQLGSESLPEEAFAIRMLCENRIRGLLPMQIRSFNGERNLYYEITHLQSLEAFCRIRPLSGRMLRVLMGDLYGLCRTLPEYILKEDGITLSPDRIFTDTAGFYFCYAPSGPKATQAEMTNAKLAFAGELLGLLDHEDEEAVLYGYRFYKAAGESGGLLGCLEKTLGEASGKDAESAPGEIDPLQNEAWGQGNRSDFKLPADGKEKEKNEEGKNGKEREQGSDSGTDIGGAILFLVLCLIGTALLVMRGMQIRPFGLGLLLMAKEGIAGSAFLLAGLAGAFLSLKKGRTDCKKS
ncbi:MAG: DUF6382 domain-containing protein [Lachnospiraceae bacterium]|nr:DUF6382 domain-containing protein [Lachnospiraceae bacterium]